MLFRSVLSFALQILQTFGFEEYDIYLSTRPTKYIGSEKNWDLATDALKKSLESAKIKYLIDEEGGVFYGPKIDIKIKDSIGRAWQCTTIQVDFNLPEKFDMFFINSQGEKERPIMIHRALLGSIERFIGVLLEHYAGDLPLWLSPTQIMIIPVSEKYQKEAQEIAARFLTEGIRCQTNNENETVSKKIREGELLKIPYLVVLGEREIKNQTLTVRKRGEKELTEVPASQLLQVINTLVQKKQ